MPRASLGPLTCVLALVTGLALLGTAVALRPPGHLAEADGAREAANRRAALRFYDATNTAIATGDLEPLAALVAPDLLADASGADPAPAGLARRLLALHATAPAFRLTIAALAVDGDLVFAQVEAEGAGPVDFLGLPPAEPPLPWGPVDVLRLADGRVVEYRSTAAAVLLEPVLAVPFDVPPGAPQVLTVRRVTLAAGAAYGAAAVDGIRLLAVEAGTPSVEVAKTAAFAAPLRAGDHLSVPAGSGYTVVNAGEAPAALLDLIASPAGSVTAPPELVAQHPDLATAAALGVAPPPGLTEQVPAGVTVVELARSQPTALPTGPLVLSIGWATLAPGACLTWAAAAGLVLLHVEAGTANPDSPRRCGATPLPIRERG